MVAVHIVHLQPHVDHILVMTDQTVQTQSNSRAECLLTATVMSSKIITVIVVRLMPVDHGNRRVFNACGVR